MDMKTEKIFLSFEVLEGFLATFSAFMVFDHFSFDWSIDFDRVEGQCDIQIFYKIIRI